MVDTFLEGNARTCWTKVWMLDGETGNRKSRRGREGREGRRGARVTESIVEAYWESANSPGFNLTGEPWTPFNIQARARARDASSRKLLQRNRHVETPRKHSHSLVYYAEERRGKCRSNETFEIFDISRVIVESFRFVRSLINASADSSFSLFIFSSFFLILYCFFHKYFNLSPFLFFPDK